MNFHLCSSLFKVLWIYSIFDIGDCLSCAYYSYGILHYRTCYSSCCGATYSTACCAYAAAYVKINSTAIIAGAVVGGIFLIAVVVGTILLYKKRAHRGRVIVAPSRSKAITVNTTKPTTSVPTVAPPAYGWPTHTYPPPPQPGPANDPAYPPPPPPAYQSLAPPPQFAYN